jgi:hypothetical protein
MISVFRMVVVVVEAAGAVVVEEGEEEEEKEEEEVVVVMVVVVVEEEEVVMVAVEVVVVDRAGLAMRTHLQIASRFAVLNNLFELWSDKSNFGDDAINGYELVQVVAVQSPGVEQL